MGKIEGLKFKPGVSIGDIIDLLDESNVSDLVIKDSSFDYSKVPHGKQDGQSTVI